MSSSGYFLSVSPTSTHLMRFIDEIRASGAEALIPWGRGDKRIGRVDGPAFDLGRSFSSVPYRIDPQLDRCFGLGPGWLPVGTRFFRLERRQGWDQAADIFRTGTLVRVVRELHGAELWGGNGENVQALKHGLRTLPWSALQAIGAQQEVIERIRPLVGTPRRGWEPDSLDIKTRWLEVGDRVAIRGSKFATQGLVEILNRPSVEESSSEHGFRLRIGSVAFDLDYAANPEIGSKPGADSFVESGRYIVGGVPLVALQAVLMAPHIDSITYAFYTQPLRAAVGFIPGDEKFLDRTTYQKVLKCGIKWEVPSRHRYLQAELHPLLNSTERLAAITENFRDLVDFAPHSLSGTTDLYEQAREALIEVYARVEAHMSATKVSGVTERRAMREQLLGSIDTVLDQSDVMLIESLLRGAKRGGSADFESARRELSAVAEQAAVVHELLSSPHGASYCADSPLMRRLANAVADFVVTRELPR